MVDDNYNSWLIEVNSSPAMDYSTKVTTRLVKQVLKDTAKVIVDWKDASRKVLFQLFSEKKKSRHWFVPTYQIRTVYQLLVTAGRHQVVH
jgi:hypothetical protein